MGITDKIASLLPRRAEHGLEDFFEELGSPRGGFSRWSPSVDVNETDKEVVVRAEVPGLDPGDVALSLTPHGLTIRGEKREEKKDKGLLEWRYGSFVETVPLPPGLDADRAEARVKNGVLTVRLPRAATPGAWRVPIDA
jgi:HSP20 family protein